MKVECGSILGVTTKVFLAGIQSQEKWHKFIFIAYRHLSILLRISSFATQHKDRILTGTNKKCLFPVFRSIQYLFMLTQSENELTLFHCLC